MNTITLDDKDLKLIKILQKDARTPFSSIAQELGITSVAVKSRFKKLKRDGVITGSIVQVDLNKFGFKCISNLALKIIPSDLEDFTGFIKGIQNPALDHIKKSVFPTMGPYNAQMLAILRNTLELETLVETMKKHPGVLDIQICRWTETGKILALPENLSLEHLKENKDHE